MIGGSIAAFFLAFGAGRDEAGRGMPGCDDVSSMPTMPSGTHRMPSRRIHPVAPRPLAAPARATLAVLLAALSVLLSTPAAHAATSGLPGPITGSDLDEWSEVLALSAEQRLAIDDAHAVYLDAYHDLERTVFTGYGEELAAVLNAVRQRPDPEALSGLVRRRETLRRRAAQSDDVLMAAIAEVLAPDQLAALARVRERRERERMRRTFLGVFGETRDLVLTDISRAVFELELGPREREAIDSVLADYERRLTTRVLAFDRHATAAIVGVVTALDDLDLAGADPQTMRERAGDRIAEAAGPATAEMARIAALHRDAVERMSRVVPPPAAQRIRDRWRTLVHRQIQKVHAESLAPFDAVLAHADLEDDVRAQVRELRRRLLGDLLDHGDRATRLREDLIEQPPVLGERSDAARELDERAWAEQLAMEQAGRDAVDALSELVGPQVVRDAERIHEQPTLGGSGTPDADAIRALHFAEDRGALARDPARGGAPIGRPVPPSPREAAPWAAGPLDAAELRRGLAWAGFTDAALDVALAAHASYRERWSTRVTSHFAPARRAGRALLAGIRGQVRTRTTVEDLESLRRMIDDAVEAVAALDSELFAALRAACPEDAIARDRVDRLERARARTRALAHGAGLAHADGATGRMAAARHAEASIDLLRTLLAQDLPVKRRNAFADVLDRLEPAHDRLAAEVLARSRAVLDARMQAGPVAARGTGIEEIEQRTRAVTIAADAYLRTVHELIRARREARKALVGVDRAPQGAAVRSSYLRQARPDAYVDEHAAWRLLAAAREDDDLPQAVRDAVDELVLVHRDAWWSRSDELALLDLAALDERASRIQSSRAPDDTQDDTPAGRDDGVMRRAAIRAEAARQEAARREVAGRVERRLAAILGPDRFARVRVEATRAAPTR